MIPLQSTTNFETIPYADRFSKYKSAGQLKSFSLSSELLHDYIPNQSKHQEYQVLYEVFPLQLSSSSYPSSNSDSDSENQLFVPSTSIFWLGNQLSQGLVSFIFFIKENWYRHSPRSLSGNTPVWSRLKETFDSIFSQLGVNETLDTSSRHL